MIMYDFFFLFSLQSDIISNVDFWVQSFESYYAKNFESPPSIFNLTELEFRQRLTQYLFSKEGSRHRLMFRYHEELICGQPAPDIQVRQQCFALCTKITKFVSVADVQARLHSPLVLRP